MKHSVGILLFLVLAHPPHLQQQSKRYVISGVVKDSLTGLPIENGIVFIEHSAQGASLAKDGTFRLSNVPGNQCAIIVSKVGYASRRIRVSIPEKDDSAWYNILLRPQPVQLAVVEVSAVQPFTLTTGNVLYPESDESDAYCVYGAETSIPIGILFGDSLIYMYAFEQCVVDSERFLQLWLLISNHSGRVVEFDAFRDVELSMNSKSRSYATIHPASAEKFPADGVNRAAETSPFLMKIQESFRASSTERELYMDKNLQFDLKMGVPFGIGRPWLGWNAPEEVQGGINPVSLYETYSNSHHGGMLRRYKIHPGNSVSGSLFFPFPGINWKSTSSSSESGLGYRYVISIRTSNWKRYIAFSAH